MDGGVDVVERGASRRGRGHHPGGGPLDFRDRRSRQRHARSIAGGRAASEADACRTRSHTVRVGTLRPTRWGSSITRTTSSGSRSGERTCCGRSAGATGRWKSRRVAAGHRGALRVPPAGAVRRRARSEDGRTDAVASADGVHLHGRSDATTSLRPRAARSTPRSTARDARAGCPIASGRCSREGARHRRGRIHRVAPRRDAARRGRGGHWPRLLHRLLPASDQGGEPAISAAVRDSVSSRRRIQQARSRPRCSTASRTCSTSPRRPACARAGGAISGPTPTTTSTRRSDCSKRASGDRSIGSSTRRARRSTATTCRSRCARTRCRSRFLPYGVTKLAAEQLCYLYFVNHGVPTTSLRYFTVYWAAPASRHGVPPVHRGRARRRADRRSTATASRRATSRSSRTLWRRRSRPASAACRAAPTTSAAARACR